MPQLFSALRVLGRHTVMKSALKGLARDDLFTVVFDQVMTDTARWADLVLPATTFLEHYDVAKGYGPISLQLVQPAIEPVGDSRPNVEVFGDLARRIGLRISSTLESDPEAVMHVSAALREDVRDTLMQAGIATPECPATPVQFVDVFPRTADGKIDLVPDSLDQEAPAGLYAYQESAPGPEYPLVLLSPATEKTVTSTLGELTDQLSELQMHPTDARARGLSRGEAVRIFNTLGEVLCPVAINPDMKPGTVSLPKGLWSKHTMNGSTVNALVADASTDLGGGAVFNDARVEVTRVVTADFEADKLAIWTTAAPSKGVH